MEPLGAMEEFVDNNVMGPLEPLDGGSFNMLTYLDDTSLLNQLGLEPTTLTDDCHSKLLDSNTTDNYTELVPPSSQQETNNYTELLAPSPQDVGDMCYTKLLDSSVNYNDLLPSTLPQQESCVTHGQATYYTITLDVESPQVDNIEGGAATTSNTLLDTSGIDALNPLILSATPVAQNQQHLTTWTVNDNQQLGLNNTSMIIQLQNNTSAILTSPEEVVVDSVPPSPVPNRNRVRGEETVQPRSNRKRKQTEAAAAASVRPAPKRRRPKKEKKYEITRPIENPDEEKKRLNAINAKKNRDKKKDLLKELSEKVSAVSQERDNLLQEVEALRQREAALRRQLETKHGVHWNGLDNSTII